MEQRRLPYRLLLALLIASAILLMLPFFFTSHRILPTYSWAPGYWEQIPGIGMARIVPVSRARLINPASGLIMRTLPAARMAADGGQEGN